MQPKSTQFLENVRPVVISLMSTLKTNSAHPISAIQRLKSWEKMANVQFAETTATPTPRVKPALVTLVRKTISYEQMELASTAPSTPELTTVAKCVPSSTATHRGSS